MSRHTPPPPPGFTIDVPPPPGFELDKGRARFARRGLAPGFQPTDKKTPESIIQATRRLGGALGGIGQDIARRAERPQPFGKTEFRGLTDPVPEQQRAANVPGVNVTPDVPVPRIAKQIATQIPAQAALPFLGPPIAEFARQKLSGEKLNPL